jgi:hypothetical protein
MSLTLTCDSCKANISPQDLKQGLALAHEGAHYCQRCKQPILAFLKRSGAGPLQGGKAAGSRPAGDDPLASLEELGSPGPRRAPRPFPSEDDLGTDLDAELEVLSGSPPSPRPEPPPAGKVPGKPPPAKGPAPKGLPVAPGGRLPSKGPPPQPPPRVAARPAAPDRPAGGQGGTARAAPPPAPGRKTAQPGRPLPGVKPQPRRASPAGGVAGGGEPPGAPGPRPPSRNRKLYLIAGIIGAAGLLGGLAIYFKSASRGSGAVSPAGLEQPAPKPPEAARAEAEVQARLKEAELAGRRTLEKFRERLSPVAEELLDLRASLEAQAVLPGLEGPYRDLLREVDQRIQAVAQAALDAAQKRSESFQKEEKFEAAYEFWKQMPEVVKKSEIRPRWIQEENQAARYARAWALWTKIDEKADRYLGQEDLEISLAILECADNYPDHCKENFPLIWEKREKRIERLRVSGESELLARVQRDRERRVAEEEARRLREERERQERWAARLVEAKWEPLLSREGGDLENWSVRSLVGRSLEDLKMPWTVQTVGGQPVLVGENSQNDEEVQVGMNGNRWLDWVLEFEVQVEAGTLKLKTRTVIHGDSHRPAIAHQAPKDFELKPESYGSWKRLRVEAQGRKVTCFEVTGSAGDGPEGEGKVKRFEVETPDHQEGGFIFVLSEKGVARLRDVRRKLVFDQKHPRDDSGDEE